MKKLILIISLLVSCISIAKAATVHVGFLRVVDTHDAMPGSGGKFQSFGLPGLSDGQVVFTAYGRLFDQGIFSNIPGYIQLVADNRTQVPDGKYNFSSFQTGKSRNWAPLISLGRIIFYATVDGNQAEGLYSFVKSRLGLLVNSDTPIPASKVNFTQFSNLNLLANNDLLFLGQHDQYYGVFALSQSGVRILMNANGTHIPKGKGNFTALSYLAADADGAETDYAFIGEGNAKQEGVYLSHKFSLKKIADENTKMPDNVGFFSHFDSIGFDDGQVAFIGSGILGQQGVYVASATGSLMKVADTQTMMPEGVSKLTHFNDLIFHQGSIVFRATSESGEAGVFLYSFREGLFKLLTNHDKINGKQVADVFIGPHSLDGKNLAMLIKFSDGSEGIYIATVSISAY